jgi:protein ImuB
VVLAADRAAEAAGLRVGMPAAKAQALLADLVIQDAGPLADAAAVVPTLTELRDSA